jgi:hypothetical protein
MAVDLSVNIGANVNEAVQGLGLVTERAKQLQDGIAVLRAKLADTKSEKFYAFALDTIAKKQAELNKIQKSTGEALNKTSANSAKATQSLSDLSRIAQDAPYGFNAIANNLNPLVESFGRLKTATGSTGGALRALLGTLSGPAGIGIAVAVASSLFLKFGDSLFGASKASKEAEENSKKLAEGVANELVKLTSLVGIAGNVNASYENRKKALQALNDQYGKYLPGLEKEKITANNLAAAYDTITESLLRQAVVKGSQAQIEQLVAETAKEIIALRLKEKKAVDDAAEAYKKQQNAAKPDESAQSKLDRYVQRVEQSNGVIRDGAIALQNQKVVQDQAIRSVNIYDVLVKQLTQDLKNQLQPLMSLTTEFSDLDTNIKNTSKDSENLITRAKALAKELAKIGAVVPEFSETQTKAQQEQIAKDFIARFKGAKLEFNVTPIIKADKIEMPPLTDGGGMSEAEKQAEKDGAILGQAFIDGRNKVLTTGFILTPEALEARNIQAAIEAAIKLGKDGAQAVNEAINSIKLEGLFSIGEALGAAFSGGEIKNVFQSFVTAISGAIVALGKQLVTLGIAAKVTKDALKTLFSNPIAMVAAGVGLIAVGSAIRGALSKGIEGREKGGPVTGNTPYIVGERGPELFVPSVGGSIIPNNRMSSFTGRPAFAMGGGGGRTIIRGNDILLASARTQRSQNRVNA